jgi:epoxyqueuosine reductase
MVDSAVERHTQLIKTWAKELGFEAIGISRAKFLEEEAPRLEEWLSKGYHAGMQYMENHFDKRLDPTLLVPGAKSVVSLLYNYYPEQIQDTLVPQLAKYAYGRDYHDVIKDKLKLLMQRIRTEIGEVDGRAFVDSAPVMERSWARLAGLGWIGRHTLLITKKKGSFFFLAELILDLELQPDSPVTDHCGSCRLCIDACPTGAIHENQVLDAGKCISYLTIELKEEIIPESFRGKMEGWYFGCDICQDVCPWNRFSSPHREPAYAPNEALLNMTASDWLDISEEVFKTLTRNSPLKRPGWKGIRRNVAMLGGESNK